MAKKLRLFLPAHEPDFGRDTPLRCPRPRISGRHRCAAERGADGAARRPHQVQGLNARSFVSGKSLLGGEGRGKGEHFLKLILAAWAGHSTSLPRGAASGTRRAIDKVLSHADCQSAIQPIDNRRYRVAETGGLLYRRLLT